jgi:hypothetical protein
MDDSSPDSCTVEPSSAICFVFRFTVGHSLYIVISLLFGTEHTTRDNNSEIYNTEIISNRYSKLIHISCTLLDSCTTSFLKY